MSSKEMETIIVLNLSLGIPLSIVAVEEKPGKEPAKLIKSPDELHLYSFSQN